MRLKNPIFETAIALFLVLGALMAFSFSGVEYKLFSMDVKRPAIKEFLTFKERPSLAAAAILPVKKNPNDSNVKVAEKTDVRKPDTSSQRILMVGESMIEGLMFPFMKYARYNHHTLKAKIWYGSRTLDWGGCDTLKKMIADFKPTFIMVSIGSNELFIRNIEEREPYVQKIVEQLGDHKFVWIGPPNPKKDNGINDMIMRNVGEDRFFVSKYMHFERRRDGVHPKPVSSRKWADSIAVWIMDKSRYPIKLTRPVFDSNGNMVDTTARKPVLLASADTSKGTKAVKKVYHKRRRRRK